MVKYFCQSGVVCKKRYLSGGLWMKPMSVENKFDMSVFRQNKSDLAKKIIIALFADVLVGFAIAFNASAGLGNDPISVLFEGIEHNFTLTLGEATLIMNCIIFAIVLLCGRHYINLGTFLYTLPLGFFVDIGVNVYQVIQIPVFPFRILISTIACIMLFLGVAIYIVIDIGVDPWTGLALMLRDRTSVEYKYFRIGIDVSSIVLGFLLGGQVGIVTLVSGLVAGPAIQKFVEILNKLIVPLLKFKEIKDN